LSISAIRLPASSAATILVFLSRVNSPLVRLTETGRGMILMSGDWEKATGESMERKMIKSIFLINKKDALPGSHAPCVQDRASDLKNTQKYKAVNAFTGLFQYTSLR
jgi:hypothetical protein